MEQIIKFIFNIFDTKDWPPRWECGEWSQFHGWLYISSDAAIWLAYFIIPVIIVWFIQNKPKFPFLPVFWLFGSFIVLCGATHLVDVIMFWWPAYRLNALVRLLTAIVSVLTMFALIKDLPELLKINYDDKSSEEKDKYIKELENKIKTLKQNQNGENGD